MIKKLQDADASTPLCDHHKKEEDPRWDALKVLKNKLS
jgi:uncharacterized metal-binding protein YceD (DUF177 family)